MTIAASAAALLFAHVFAPHAWIDGVPIPTTPSHSTEAEVTSPPASDTRPNQVGVQFELLPVGVFHFDGDTYNLKTTMGVGGLFAHDVMHHFSVGFAPRIVSNIQGEGGGASLTEYDLRARAALHAQWQPPIEMYAFLEPGWSIVSAPKGSISGFVAAVGVGGTYDITDSVYMNIEFGFQGGFQAETVGGNRVAEQFHFLHLGLGAGARF